jgi:hypothetical protein
MKKSWLIILATLGIACVAVAYVVWPYHTLAREAYLIANIYTGKAIITGQRDETRIPGFGRALLDALKKVSGDPSLSEEEMTAAAGPQVQEFVESYHEHDRMEGIPIHDEQGTRDRPFDLVVDFHKGKVDRLLHALKRQPWLALRPEVPVLLVVHFDDHSYVLTADEEQGTDQRDALIATAWQAGVPFALPLAEGLQSPGLDPGKLFPSAGVRVNDLRQRFRLDHLLVGRISWKDGMAGWKAEWIFNSNGTDHRWQIVNVNFDDAFRSAMRGVAEILSGHGEPEGHVP